MSGIKKIFAFACITMLVFILAKPALAAPHGSVTFLDVGEGEAIFVESPSGERFLVDTANPLTAHHILEHLEQKGISSLDALFITHPHPDHMGGVFQLVSEIEVMAVYDNGEHITSDDADIYRWYAEASRRDNYKALSAGDYFDFGGVKVEVLWPKKQRDGSWNDNSLVIRVICAEVVFLLMGDVSEDVEKTLLEEEAGLEADVLKVAHHGAGDSTSESFLDAVSPRYAVISIDSGNERGYPAAEVLGRLEDKQIETLITYNKGDIEFTVSPEGRLLVNVD